MRRGSARSWDHAQLVHAQVMHAVIMKMSLFVLRVATDDNIADLPSRGARPRALWCCPVSLCGPQELSLLRRKGAIELEPCLQSVYQDNEAGAVLQERWKLLDGL